MRITGGTLRGRVLKVGGGLRPTQDKVRQAIFSAIASHIEGARVLDLFAGTGSLGLEAWSRGAASVCWVESHARTCHALRGTVRELCGEAPTLKVVQADALSFLNSIGPDRAGPADERYDVVLADPPYDRDRRFRWLEKTLRALDSASIVTPLGVLVFEMSAGEEPLPWEGWTLAWDRTYGDTRVVIYRKT